MKKESIIALIELYRSLREFHRNLEDQYDITIENDLFLCYLDIVNIVAREIHSSSDESLSNMIYEYVNDILQDNSISSTEAYNKLQ